jgi:hypothetical protein
MPQSSQLDSDPSRLSNALLRLSFVGEIHWVKLVQTTAQPLADLRIGSSQSALMERRNRMCTQTTTVVEGPGLIFEPD